MEHDAQNSIQLLCWLIWAFGEAFQHQRSSAFEKNIALCVFSELGESRNVSQRRDHERPTVSHSFSETPAQPSIWNSHCPEKRTVQPAQACSYLSMHASPRQPLPGCDQLARDSSHMHADRTRGWCSTVVEPLAAVMTWIPLGSILVSVLTNVPHLWFHEFMTYSMCVKPNLSSPFLPREKNPGVLSLCLKLSSAAFFRRHWPLLQDYCCSSMGTMEGIMGLFTPSLSLSLSWKGKLLTPGV